MNSPATFTQLIMRRLLLWSMLSIIGGLFLFKFDLIHGLLAPGEMTSEK